MSQIGQNLSMSNIQAQAPFAHRGPPPQGSSGDLKQEDCRDYLRTGRCKYGASCKYNHPSNVQSGGGMRNPIDPSEPLFPVRPNEPVCQYYMKHGTCKFGQACKFNHPPQTSPPSSLNATAGNTGVRKNEQHSMLWNSAGNDSNIQLLPQRPDEPNCIYFLKNGRCKYGATCRYHHPLNYHHDRRPQNIAENEGRRHQYIHVPSESIHKIHYVTSLPPGSQQGHFVVSDGAVTFVTIDGNNSPQLFPIPQSSSNNSTSNNKDGTLVYSSQTGRPLGMSREVASSSSSTSIASSFETANSSNVDQQQHGDSSSSLWNNRTGKSGSGTNLSAYSIPENDPPSGSQQQHVLHGSRTILIQGDVSGSVNGLPRVVSSGSAGESGQIYFTDNNGTISRQVPLHHAQATNGEAWRGRRANSFDHVSASQPSFQYDDDYFRERAHDDEVLQGSRRDAQRPPPGMRGRPPSGTRQRRAHHGSNDDDGLSMMTSALLTMLDTPEEAAAAEAEENGSYDPYEEHRGHSSQRVSPQLRPHQFYATTKGDRVHMMPPADAGLYHSGGDEYNHQGGQRYFPHQSLDQDRWSPQQWQGANTGRPLQDSVQTLSVVHSQTPNTSSHASSDVGLYLP